MHLHFSKIVFFLHPNPLQVNLTLSDSRFAVYLLNREHNLVRSSLFGLTHDSSLKKNKAFKFVNLKALTLVFF